MSAYAMPGLFPPPCVTGPKFTRQEQSQQQGPTTPLPLKSITFSSSDSFNVSPVESPKPNQEFEHNKDIEILVKGAKIDFTRLIKSLTVSTQMTQLPPVPPLVHGSTARTDPIQKLNPEAKNKNVHKEAVQFELRINFNGRTYSATRTLNQIFQLQDELIAETKNNSRNKRRYISSRTKTAPTKEVVIPELPDYNEGTCTRGFTMIHALMQKYCPIVQQWLRSVSDIVPDSSSLINFLWEPLSERCCDSLLGSNRSNSTLLSIKEDECDTTIFDETTEEDFCSSNDDASDELETERVML